MNKELISIKKIKSNESNPRIINKKMFEKLKNSIKQFPEMLETRPIVVDEDFMVLGGNMRLKACESLNIKKVWIYQVKDWTKDQKKEFIIKDNASFGEWDWHILANDYSFEELKEWGIDTLSYIDEPELDELDDNLKNKDLKMAITFKNLNDLNKASDQIKLILKDYKGSFYSISGDNI